MNGCAAVLEMNSVQSWESDHQRSLSLLASDGRSVTEYYMLASDVDVDYQCFTACSIPGCSHREFGRDAIFGLATFEIGD